MSDFKKLTVAQLKEELTSRGLDTGGLKPALLARLEAAAAAAGAGASAAAATPAAATVPAAAPAAPPPAPPAPSAPPAAAEVAPAPLRAEAKRKEPEPDTSAGAAGGAPSAAAAAEAPARKRSRWDSAEGGPAGAAPAPPPAAAAALAAPAGDAAATDAAAKAREVLQKKEELAAKLAKLRQLKGAAGGAAPAAPAAPAALPASLAGVLAPDAVARVQAIASRLAAGGPAPAPGLLRAPGTTGFSAAPPAAAAPPPRARPVALRLDAQGREVDEHGHVIVREVKAVATLRVNARAQKAEELRALMDEARREIAAETAAGGVDEAAKRRNRETRSLQFMEPGLATARAEASRMQAALRAQFGDAADAEARRMAARAKRREDEAARIAGYEAAGAAEAAAGGAAAVIEADVPDAEWWDAPLLGGASYDAVLSGAAPLVRDKISVYVEHPVPLAPPGEAPPPPPQPLKLTAKEQKKLRTQRRVAREKERQEMLRQGLLEPPKPKVRIANLMRVLGEQATADPTAIEKEVRAQMAERAAAHEDRNAARALTPAERREKQARKLFEDAHGGGELQCAVYRVESLAHPLNSYKVLLNAEENQLTGCGLKTEAFALVIVEGARKAIARYNKLMLRRMNWKLRREPRDADADGQGDGDGDGGIAAEEDAEARQQREEEEEAAAEANKCTLVWQGALLKPAFKRFKYEPIRSAAGAAKYLEDMGLRNFWDLAAAGVSVE